MLFAIAAPIARGTQSHGAIWLANRRKSATAAHGRAADAV